MDDPRDPDDTGEPTPADTTGAHAAEPSAEPEIGNEVWEAGEESPRLAEALVVSLDGFAGPLDVLLALARTQKVDLAKISVLALAEQYLGFIAQARTLRLELAADYLVMAAWLAYLKSKLLLPREPSTADQPSGADRRTSRRQWPADGHAGRTRGRARRS